MKTALPGLLIEHLVSGVVAAVWLLPLLDGSLATVGVQENLLFFAPAAYVLGMLVDFAAFCVFFIPKHVIRRAANRAMGRAGESTSGSDRKIAILVSRPLLLEEVERRSSRDRIARCTVLNLLAIVWVHDPFGSVVWSASLVFGAALFWAYTELMSYRYELKALTAIETWGAESSGES